MAKPVLGRSLGKLLSGGSQGPRPGTRASSPPAAPAGVQLLLCGDDGRELVPPAARAQNGFGGGARIPAWVFGLVVLTDLALLLVAAWVVLVTRAPGRLIVATLLVFLGGGLLCLASWLRGELAERELRSLNPLEEDRPHVRVHFLDELPRPRR